MNSSTLKNNIPRPSRMSMNQNNFSPMRVSVVNRMSVLNPDMNSGSLNATRYSSFPGSNRYGSPEPRLSALGSAVKVPFNPKQYNVPGLSELDIEQLKEVFDYYDKDGNGLLAPNEIRAWLYQGGYKATKETVYDIIAEYDDDEKGAIQFNEFLKFMARGKPENYESKDEIAKLFKKFDQNRKGYIDINDLRAVVKGLSEDLDEELLFEIITKVDSNMDGKISFEDFYNVIVKKVNQDWMIILLIFSTIYSSQFAIIIVRV